ncbi:hypothetical protein FOA19_16215 [Rufibacter hautae]|uniref:Uncharacterized protein n=2 Tax=Rufibacter hautae TaxID=2595005 RepID=A0A5B6TE70_9BACT|nr:hypothetical protein FOA19_16215 [Rufibacter hautae]
MESSRRKYLQLVAVEILHHYFLDEGGKVYDGTQDLPAARKAQKLKTYDTREWLAVEPDAATHKALQAYQVLLKPTKTGFLLLTQLTDVLPGTKKPLANLEKMVLGFWLKWQTPQPGSQAALASKRQAAGERGFYLLGNQWARMLGGTYPHLGVPLPTYHPEEEYLPGDLVRKDSKHYRALVKSKGAALTDTTLWKPTDNKLPYVSRQSLQIPAAAPPGEVWGRLEIAGKGGLSNYSLLTGSGDLKNAQVYKIHLDKM